MKKYAWWISSPTRLQVSWMPSQERGEAPAEDLVDVDVPQLAVEPAEQALGLGANPSSSPPGDLAERLAAAGDAEPDGAGEVGVEHEVADHPLGVDPVVVLAEVGLVGRAAPQQARPVDDPHRRLGDGPAVAEPVHLDVQDPADLVDPLEVAAELEEVEDLGPRQGAVDQAVEEDADRLIAVEEPRRAGARTAAGLAGCRGRGRAC